jgi:hypothetical protein
VPLQVLPHAQDSYPKLYGVKILNLILLAWVLPIASCASALPRPTPSSATGTRLISEIVRCQDAQFDTAGLGVGDRFLIDTGFGIVTDEYMRLALLPELAEPDLDFAGYFLVLG